MLQKQVFALFSVLCFALVGTSQTHDLDTLLKQKKYDTIINTLETKADTSKLSNKEYKILSRAFFAIEDNLNGIVYADKLITQALRQNDTSYIIKGYLEKMTGYYYLEDLENAATMGEKIIPYLTPKDSIEKTILYLRLGILLNETDNNTRAYEIYKNINFNVIKHRNLESLYYNNYTNILSGLNKKDSLLYYLKKSLFYDKVAKDTVGIISGYNGISKLYIDDFNNPRLAITYLDSIDALYKTYKYPLKFKELNTFLTNYYRAYHRLKNIDSCLVFLERISQLNEDYFKQRLDSEIQELKHAYERENRLMTKVDLADKQLNKSKQQQLWLIITFLTALIILGFIVFVLQYQKIKIQHDTISTEQKLLRSQMTPHFIFNSLSTIQGMILNKEDKKAVDYLSKFSKLMRLTLENSRSKLVSLEDEIATIKNYLELQSSRFNNAFSYTIDIDTSVPMDILIPPMIIQPFIENAIEHGFKFTDNTVNTIDIQIKMQNDNLTCVIKDNGIGIDKAKQQKSTNKKSLSTTITKERLNLLSKDLKHKANIIIEDRTKYNEKGSIVTLQIPYKH